MGDATHKSAISSLQEVRDLIKELPEPDLESAKKAASHDAQLTKPLGSLGKLEDLVEPGLIDPAKTVKCALQNAASAAGTLLTTNCAVLKKGGE